MTIIFLLIIMFVCKLMYDILYYYTCKYYFNKYNKWLENDKSDLPNKNIIIDIFKRAKIINNTIPILENAGYGRLLQMQVDLFDNIFSRRKDIASMVYQGFMEAKAFYKSEIFFKF
jgi:hypothetical protein